MRHAIFVHYAYAMVSAEFNCKFTVQLAHKLVRLIESPSKCRVSNKRNNGSIVTQLWECNWTYSHAVFKLLLHSGLARENRVPNGTAENQNTCFNQCILHRAWLQLMANDKPKLTKPIDSSVSLDCFHQCLHRQHCYLIVSLQHRSGSPHRCPAI